jgi:glucosamine--fructose-6-phosphate aminotransferase (isomerizing)
VSGTVIFLIIIEDEHFKFMKTVAHEVPFSTNPSKVFFLICSHVLCQVKARGAYIIAISNSHSLSSDASGLYDRVLWIPDDGTLSPLLAVFPLQLIAYEMAILRGNDPDRPRNLAKCVTVD